MPKKLEECVKALMKKPDFKPRRKGQTKREAAWAVCTAKFGERHSNNALANISEDASMNEIREVISHDSDAHLVFLLMQLNDSEE